MSTRENIRLIARAPLENMALKHMFCVRKRNVSLRRFLTHTNHMFDRKKLIIIIFWGYIFLCLPPYNTNF